MKRRHHLEWYRFQKYRSPNWRRRRDRFHSLEVILRVTSSTGAPLVNLLNGGFVGDPPTMEVSDRNSGLPEVDVVFTTDTSHCLLKAGQLVRQIFYGVEQDVQLRGLLSHHFPQLVGLEKATSG